MSYREAKRLRPGDEVTIKRSNTVCRVVEIDSQPDIGMVFFKCDNGKWYDYVDVMRGKVDCSKSAEKAAILSAIGNAIVDGKGI